MIRVLLNNKPLIRTITYSTMVSCHIMMVAAIVMSTVNGWQITLDFNSLGEGPLELFWLFMSLPLSIIEIRRFKNEGK